MFPIFSGVMNWLVAWLAAAAALSEEVIFNSSRGEQESPTVLMQRGSNQTGK